MVSQCKYIFMSQYIYIKCSGGVEGCDHEPIAGGEGEEWGRDEGGMGEG